MKPTYTFATVTSPEDDNLQYLNMVFLIMQEDKDGNDYLLQLSNVTRFKWFNKSELTLHTQDPRIEVKKEEQQQPTLLPFDLEVALAYPERVITRGGVKIRYIHEIPLNIKTPLFVILEGDVCGDQHTKEGKYLIDDRESDCDLFLLPETRVEYIVVTIINCWRLKDLDDAIEIAKDYNGFITKVTYQDNKIIHKEILENI
jgi:hypothetical protein